MAARAQEISQEAGSKVAAAMKEIILGAAGLAGFAVESARDLVQYMVRRGQMTPEEGDKLLREAEEGVIRTGRPIHKPAPAPPRPFSSPPPVATVATSAPRIVLAAPSASAPAAAPASRAAARSAAPASKPSAAKPSGSKPSAAKAPAKGAAKKTSAKSAPVKKSAAKGAKKSAAKPAKKAPAKKSGAKKTAKRR
ncbi:MAG TPA: hypothetical protein VFZ11_15075 [Gemmatimonadaceae bacterium]